MGLPGVVGGGEEGAFGGFSFPALGVGESL